jgi:hypothetical protein
MAVETTRQIFLLLKDVTTNTLEEYEEVFVQAIAPEILGAARMENQAALEIMGANLVHEGATSRIEAKAISEVSARYEQKGLLLPAQKESEQVEN